MREKNMGKFVVKDTTRPRSGSNQERSKTNTPDDGRTEPSFASDLPPDIIFPDQLNRYLRDQIHGLTLENGGLRRSLEETQEELTRTKEKLTKAGLPAPMGRVAEAADYKIAQLSKRLREQNAEMESLRTQTKEAEAKLRRLEEKASTSEEPSEPTPPSELAEKDRQIKLLTEKLQASNAKMCDFRNQYQSLKQEMKLAQKVIENEVGDKCSIQDLAKESGNWRGRAQQILTLQSRVQQLQEQLSNTSCSENPASTVLRQMEKDRRANYEETSKQLNQKTIQMEDLKKKLDASKARNKVLENEVVQVKTKMSSLAEKSSRDEQLLSTLTNQINAFEDRGKAQMQCFSKMQGNLNKLQQELELERTKNDQLQRALADRENKVRKMEDQMLDLRRKGKLGPADVATADKFTDAPQETDDAKGTAAADAERLRLLELLTVINGRLESARGELTEADAQLRRERYRNAKLETKIARLELEKIGAMKTGRGSYSHASNRGSEPSINEADILAQQQIEYLQEECLALRTRMETLQMEKEADLKAFALMAEVRDGGTDSFGDGRPFRRRPQSPAERLPASGKIQTGRSTLGRRKVRGSPVPTTTPVGMRQSSFSSEDIKYYEKSSDRRLHR